MENNLEEKLRWFWMGKQPRIRKAVEEYLRGIEEGKRDTQERIAKKYGCATTSIRNNIKKLHEHDLLRCYLSEWLVKTYEKEQGTYPDRWN